jgi:hypothetical protein
MRVLFFLSTILLLSCNGSDQSDKPMTWEDSVVKETNVKIEKLENSGDSIEKVNHEGTRKQP